MEFLKQYQILLKKAKADLKASKILLIDFEKGDDELDLETIMFHLQQCAEKLLKSILSYNNQHFTKTHDIKILIEAIKENAISTIDEIEDLIPLTDYAVEGRYSILHDDLNDTGKYITLLEQLKIAVEDIIKND